MALRSQRSTARPRVGRVRPLRRWTVASCLLSAALVAACGGGSSPETSSAPPSAAAAGSSSLTDQPASTSTTAKPEREYPAGGPTDIIVPPNKPSYELINGRAGCQELLNDMQTWTRDGDTGVDALEGADTYPLYQSAALVCLGRWQEAKSSFDDIKADPVFLLNPCPRKALFEWLRALIHAWDADHNFSPVFVKSSKPSPCPSENSTSTGSTDGSSSSSGSSTTTIAG
jgi:hypothetical protein